MLLRMMLKLVLIVGLTTHLRIDIECKSIQNDSVNNEQAVLKLKQTVLDLSVKVQTLNESLQHVQHKNNPVMFYAIIKNKHYVRHVDTTLVFETVIINEGGHYDPYDGVFVSPEKGIYLFSWTVTGYAKNWIATELLVEENIISSAGEYNGGGGRSSGSMTALCKMGKGDHAFIRTTGISSAHNVYSHDNHPQTAFLGILIRYN